ncbi:amidohydrolase family protein [Paraburkholderia sp.]|uniref:amidohydrolase family protein n=1 Tax=Paraburkholderia sp. TaxID=1926495 RepID=UPI00286F554B|nr:amidohydrolase family protein [Paraburkholderia sp.]
MQVVDPHVHFWDLDTHHYPWLAKPATSFVCDARELKHNYLPADLVREAGDIHVLKVVHVEANHDPADPVEETRWLESLAEADGNPAHGLPNAIVAACDLSAANAPDILAQHAAFKRVRGIRQILNVHTNSLYDYVGRHYMRETLWREHFALLEQHDFSFDLQLYPAQMEEAAALARAHPGIALVVNHCGMFVDRSSVAGWRAWREGLRLLAACPNVSVKISGLAMFDHTWSVESLRPYVLEAIDAFGVERAMFASNFPVDRLFGSYADLWHAYAAIVSDASERDRHALFCGNAERIYRI